MFDRTYSGTLTKFETRAKGAHTTQVLALRFSAVGEAQSFLDSLGSLPTKERVPSYFKPDVAWSKLTVDVGYNVRVGLAMGNGEQLWFPAILHTVAVSKVWKHGADVFTYTVRLEKELDPIVDKDLAHFVNTKARNPQTDKLEAVEWPWTFEAGEPVAQSVDTGDGDADPGA